jgi:hypothetical protein
MQSIAQALAPLGPAGKVRVIRWAGDLYSAGLSPIVPRSQFSTRVSTSESPSSTGNKTSRISEFAALADFYSAASPTSDASKVLVVSYWKQVRGGEDEVEAQAVNSELKHLGHRVGNVTRAFEQLKALKPQLMVQVRKAGVHKQSRKRYRVTTEGQREVEKMLSTST